MAGYNSGDDDQHMPYRGGGLPPGTFINPLFTGFPGMMGNMMGHGPQPAPPSAFRRPYTAHSSVLHELTFGKGNQGAHITDGGRTQVMFGGQVMLPQSALRHLTELEIEGPWTFEIINSVQRRLKTHAGVLEFHSQEGTVFLPSWMMRRLELNEGDPVQLFGTRLPKGKFVKLQAQSVLFLELSDPKAVLEQALRSYSVLTQGDIIEISHNMMTFELLVMEIKPEGAGISILNTDLEVDFAAPVGYVEPERKPAAPAPTMKSKMQINTQQTQDVDAAGRGSGASTPAHGGAPATNGSQGGTASGTSMAAVNSFEAFRGIGTTMGGKRIRGKGISVKKAEPVSEDSKIFRTDQVRIITSDTQIGTRKVPAALNLPEGVLFFGFDIKPPPADIPHNGTEQPQQNAGGVKPPAFTGAGAGVTLSGRAPRPQPGAPTLKRSSGMRPPDKSADVILIDSD